MRLRHRSGLAPPAWLPDRVILKKAGAMTLIVFFLLLKYTRICNIFKTNIWSLNFGKLGTLKNQVEVSKIHLLSFYYFLTSYLRYLKFFNNKNLFLAWDPFNIQSQANMRALHKKDPFPIFLIELPQPFLFRWTLLEASCHTQSLCHYLYTKRNQNFPSLWSIFNGNLLLIIFCICNKNLECFLVFVPLERHN